MSGASPEEKAVLEAARFWATTEAREREFRKDEEDLLDAVEALEKTTAPKKPVTAEERVERAIENGRLAARGNWDRMSTSTCNAVIIEIREAESAAWDRALNRVLDILAGPSALHADVQTIEGLLGRCHEGGATT